MSINIEKKSEQILINVTPSMYKLLAKIAEIESRPVGYVARELMNRGTDMYIEDGKLREIDSREAVIAAMREGIRRGIPDTSETNLAPVVATIGSPKSEAAAEMSRDDVHRTINPDETTEIERRLRSGKGIPVAPTGSKIKTEKDYTQAKRKAR